MNRCKERKLFMKDAVAARNAFASAHSAYAVALRDTGSALHDFALLEVADVVCSTSSDLKPQVSSSSAVKSPIDSSLPPPPPPPDFSSSPLQRAVSMPEIPPTKLRSKKSGDLGFQASATIAEDDGGEPEIVDPMTTASPPPPPRTPPPGWDFFFGADNGVPPPPPAEKEDEGHRRTTSAPSIPPAVDVSSPPVPPETPVIGNPVKRQKGLAEQKRSKTAAVVTAMTTTSSVSFLNILIGLDDHFLKAFDSAQHVSSMLEAKRMHYHSNFADNRGAWCSWVLTGARCC